jgi:hypothetical protein
LFFKKMARALETVVPNWYIELRQSQWSRRRALAEIRLRDGSKEKRMRRLNAFIMMVAALAIAAAMVWWAFS